MTPEEIEDIELHLFLEGLVLRHGYDFRHYARASLKRRLQALCQSLDKSGPLDLLPRLIRDPVFLTDVLAAISVPVTALFRDPPMFHLLGRAVLPLLDSYPRIAIWQAGCATGEEAYSLAILLKEAGLLSKTTIFATDINDHALAQAEEGIYPAAAVADRASRYREAGGTGDLSDHLRTAYGFSRFNDDLRSRIVFAHHNLAADGVFCEVNMVLCRNVLIYFDRTLQEQVLALFADALVRGGFLCLGGRETPVHSSVGPQFRPIAETHGLFRKVEAAP